EEYGAAPLAADADPLDEAERRQDDRAPDPDLSVGGDERDQEGRAPHQHQGGNQGRFPTDPVTEVPEDGGPDRSGQEPDGVDRERLERPRPADRDDGAPEVALVLGVGERGLVAGHGGHWIPPHGWLSRSGWLGSHVRRVRPRSGKPIESPAAVTPPLCQREG